MKKNLYTFLIFLGALMISSQVFAQNADGEKLRPYVGGTYDYTFNGLTDGLTYDFYISTSAVGIGAADAGLTGYITSGLTGTVSGNKAVATIAWPAGATVNTEVYLFVKISGAGVCANYNAVGITPIANSFALALVDDLSATNPSCPDLTGFNALVAPTPSYNAGTTELTFTFTKSGNTNDWNAGFNIVQVGTGDYSYKLGSGSTVSVTADNDTTPVAVTGLSNNTQVLTIVVNNIPGETPSFQIVPTSAVDAITGVSPTLPASVTHSITEMPAIGAFN